MVPRNAHLFLVRRLAGISTIEALTQESTSALVALGVQLSDVLSADRILLVEGPSDRAILEEWFPDVVHDPGVQIIEAGGGDYARYVDTLAKWLEAVDRLGPQRRILFLRDRDELPERVLQRLRESPSIHALERRELENYLLDPVAISDVLGNRHAVAVKPTDLAAAIRVTADGLKEVIVLKRVARQLQPVGWVGG
jgi:predicted ATP-dependent endonuclease of OLD family